MNVHTYFCVIRMYISSVPAADKESEIVGEMKKKAVLIPTVQSSKSQMMQIMNGEKEQIMEKMERNFPLVKRRNQILGYQES